MARLTEDVRSKTNVIIFPHQVQIKLTWWAVRFVQQIFVTIKFCTHKQHQNLIQQIRHQRQHNIHRPQYLSFFPFCHSFVNCCETDINFPLFGKKSINKNFLETDLICKFKVVLELRDKIVALNALCKGFLTDLKFYFFNAALPSLHYKNERSFLLNKKRLVRNTRNFLNSLM